MPATRRAEAPPVSPASQDAGRGDGWLSDLLHRTLGETISVETVRGAGVWRIEVDPTGLEAAILNLAVNARDAMPDGGRLTIESVLGQGAIVLLTTHDLETIEPITSAQVATMTTRSARPSSHNSTSHAPSSKAPTRSRQRRRR